MIGHTYLVKYHTREGEAFEEEFFTYYEEAGARQQCMSAVGDDLGDIDEIVFIK